jgi:DNA-binding NarL/FixJ family response regulator
MLMDSSAQTSRPRMARRPSRRSSPRTAMHSLGADRDRKGLDVSLLLVEDDAMVRSWVRLSLRASEFRVTAEASSAVEALELLDAVEPDFLLVDYHLPDHRGTELIRELRRRGTTAPAVMMTANHERGFNETARDAGAQGSVLKTGSPIELLEALRTVLAGRPAFDPRHPRRDPGRAALSPREREVLSLVAEGATNQEIAKELGIGVETVKTLLGRTFSKLGVQRRAQAVAAAHERGFL